MSKYRIYELAKEFSTTSKVILDVLSRNNCETAKNHMSSVGDTEKDIIKKTFAVRKTVDNTAVQVKRPVVNEQRVAPQLQTKPQENVHNQSNQQNRANPQQRTYQDRTNQHNNPGQTSPQHRPDNNRRNMPVNNGATNHSATAQNRPQGNRPATRPANNNIAATRPQQGNQPNRTNNQPNRNNNTNSNAPQNRNNNTVNSNAPQNRNNTTNGNAPQNRGNGTSNQQNTANRGPNRGPNNRPNNGRKGAFGQLRNQHNKNNRNNRNNNHAGHDNNKPARPVPEKPTVIKLGDVITVKEFAQKLGYEVSDIIKKLMMLGIMATINQEIDLDTATLIAEEFGVTVEELPPEEDPTEIPEIVDDPSTLLLRPPVVTVMGHVDHGKTSLLDVIRKTSVTAKEAGGITQHIGAYQAICQKKKIVFLDTPGHEAFTAMRARGAQVTDIAILVVAADDGVMPQTIEAINHAKSANVPIIVAINKIDREGANPEHVKQQLSEYGLIPEDWGGDTIMVPVSARQRTGINELLEMILLVAEMQELKANPNRAAQGIIIEAQLDKGRGPVATVLVQTGTLHIGDSIIAGIAHGKVRAMINDRGEKVKKAGPSTPVEVLGLADVPAAGDILASVDEKLARSIAEKRIAKRRNEEMMHSQKVSLDDLFQQIQDGNIKDLNILIKADVQGSVEALRSSLLALNTSTEVRVTIIHAGAGAVNESDVMLATAANALIIAFNVRPDANARKLADTENIDIRTYRVIYEAINDVQAAMTGMLAPQYKEVIQGKVEIRQVMSFSKALVAGSYVLEGKVTNSSSIRIIRDGVVVHEGSIESLRRFKDDVKEVAAGYECGITIDKFRDFKEGDIIEAFTMEEVKPTAKQLQ